MGLFAPAVTVEDPSTCLWYHTMDLPGVGVVSGPWDLRGHERAYLGAVAFDGRRVLDLGTANGALAFWMEREGANVVAFDLGEDDRWDRVPYSADDANAVRAQEREHIRQLRRGFWLAHRSYNSQVQLATGSIYAIPQAIGRFDVVVFGSIFQHLRDPVRALEIGCAFSDDMVIVTDTVWRRALPRVLLSRFTGWKARSAWFLPNASAQAPKHSWWLLSPDVVTEALLALGFPETKLTFHLQRFEGRRHLLYTIVARRRPAVQ